MTNRMVSLLLLLAGMIFWACTRSLDAPFPTRPTGIRDTAGNIRTVLRNSPFTLFNRAFARARLDSTSSFYTVFAPSDSAMTAAGLISPVIDTLPLDSLYKIVAYHVVPGAYGDASLENDTLTLQLPTLLVNTITSESYQVFSQTLYQQNLYLIKNGVLYVNGLAANQGEPARKASNGWVYPVNRVLQPPTQTVWSIINSRPELSLYVAANQLVDSMYTYFYGATVDSVLFSTVNYITPVNGAPAPQEMFTVLAPTNAAFANAGFHTVDDIRNYVLQSIPNSIYVISPYPPYNYINVNNYNAMDSVLKLHYLNNPGQSPVFYQDMLHSPTINDGFMNANAWYTAAYAYATQWDSTLVPFYPQFSNHDGTVYIQWSDSPAIAPAVLPPGGGYLGTNGVVYEINQLFYPHN